MISVVGVVATVLVAVVVGVVIELVGVVEVDSATVCGGRTGIEKFDVEVVVELLF